MGSASFLFQCCCYDVVAEAEDVFNFEASLPLSDGNEKQPPEKAHRMVANQQWCAIRVRKTGAKQIETMNYEWSRSAWCWCGVFSQSNKIWSGGLRLTSRVHPSCRVSEDRGIFRHQSLSVFSLLFFFLPGFPLIEQPFARPETNPAVLYWVAAYFISCGYITMLHGFS